MSIQKFPSIIELVKKTWPHISESRRLKLKYLICLMIFASVTEVISIGAVIPFLAVITNPESISKYEFTQPLINFLGISSPVQLVLPITVIFTVAALISGFTRLLLLWLATRQSYLIGADLNLNVYRRTLFQPYEVHISRSSSEIINGIAKKTDQVIFNLILPVLDIISSSFLIIAILLALLLIDPLLFSLSILVFGLTYFLIMGLTKNRLQANSRQVAVESTKVIKSMQEGLGGIRDILIDGTQDYYSLIYQRSDLNLRNSQANTQFLNQSPRYLVEFISLILIAWLAFFFTGLKGGETTNVIPILGAIALGAQKLLPLLNRVYNGWSSINGSTESIIDVLNLLDQPLDNKDKTSNDVFVFAKKIEFKNISFSYKNQREPVLRNLNLIINKSEKIGIVGETGCGKSTLLDIIMGLLQISSGEFLVDGVQVDKSNINFWQSHVTHVPQSIYLSDCSIMENIAFSIPLSKIDVDRVIQAAKNSQLHDLIESWPDKYNTLVGERGVNLSGGQRQRIGIARALYKKASVIILDEATSSLDAKTEQEVIKSIDNLPENLTVIMVAHRISSLKNCDRIFEISRDGILVSS